MEFKKLETACGAPLFFLRDDYTNCIGLALYVKVGSADEEAGKTGLAYGVAHALEHMVFEKTESFPSIKELAGHIENVGGAIGAGTSRIGTFFWTLVPKQNLERGVRALYEMIVKPVFTEKLIEKEIRVIIQEMNEYEDTPNDFIEDAFHAALFKNSPLGHRVVGEEKEKLFALMPRDFQEFHKKFYYPENWSFIVSGEIEARAVKKVIDKYFGWELKTNREPNNRIFSMPLPETRFKVIERCGIQNAYLMIGNAFPYFEERNGILADIFAVMLDGVTSLATDSGKGFSFPMTEILRNGITYSQAAEVIPYRNLGLFYIKLAPLPSRAEEAIMLTRKLIDVSKDDLRLLERAKKAMTNSDNLGVISLIDNLEAAGDEIGLFGKPISFKERDAQIKSVKIEEIKRFVDEFLSPEKLVTVILKPQHQKSKLK
jgi:predicted Zn-dependent peptidase